MLLEDNTRIEFLSALKWTFIYTKTIGVQMNSYRISDREIKSNTPFALKLFQRPQDSIQLQQEY